LNLEVSRVSPYAIFGSLSSMDRALVFETKGYRFESYRV